MSSEIKFLSLKDSDVWNSYIGHFSEKDISHTPEYLKVYSKKFNTNLDDSFCGIPSLLVYSEGKDFVINPVLLRKINDLPEFKDMTECYDIISPYGYSGPLIHCEKDTRNSLIDNYFDKCRFFFKEKKIVSEFIRYNPILNNHLDFLNHGNISKTSQIVVIELDKELSVLKSNLNKKTRNQIRRSKTKGVKVKIRNDIHSLKSFFDIYSETMKYNSASQKYNFEKSFFKNNMSFLGTKINLFVAELDGKVISSSLFVNSKTIMNYYFSGTTHKYRNYYPNNLIIWEAIKWGKGKKIKMLNLGGGRSNLYDDNLLYFKRGFSKGLFDFYTSSLIHDNKMYDELKNIKGISNSDKEESGFFPAYRL